MEIDVNYSHRIKELKKKLRRKKLDGLLVSQPHNRRYLSGFSAVDHNIGESSGHLLIPAHGKGILLTDFRYQLQAEEESSHLKVQIYRRGLSELLQKLLPKLDIHRLGFESDYMLHSSHQKLTRALEKKGGELIPTTSLIEKMRLIKDDDEIARIKKSVGLNEQVFSEIYPTITSGQSEVDVALALEQRMRKLGASSPSFDTIVASAANSALPHAVPGRSSITKGCPLTIDMGLVLDGYCSDMTRTFVPGKPDKKYKKIHRIVRKAQKAGIAAIRPGATGKAVDKAAREIITDAGYGKYFGHSLGHGVGLEVHEGPRLSPRSEEKLRPGMIVTVEPGIYLPGWGGIRLEDMVLVTEDGAENLNSNTTWLDI